jgi:spore germination protein GerM
VREVDDDTVPYHLLEPSLTPARPPLPEEQPGRVPVVFWLDGERLVPEGTGDSCSAAPGELVQRLLSALAAGPSDEARATGESSAIPPDSGLELVGTDGDTAEVDIEPETSISAERLPLAVGQIVLTVTSAPTVDAVVLLSDGESVQVPLPGGALTDGPVTAEDYTPLLPDRYQRSTGLGCPEP